MKEFRKLLIEKQKNLFKYRKLNPVKNAFIGSFFKISEETEEKLDLIEKRVLSSLEDSPMDYTIYSCLFKKDRLKVHEDEFFPLFPEDFQEKNHDIIHIKTKKSIIVDTCFLDLPYEKIGTLKDRVFPGKIISDSGEYNIGLKLIPSKKYRKVSGNLHRVFIKNKVRWTSLNIPYLQRMYDLVIVRYPVSLKNLMEIDDITYDLMEIEKNWHRDHILAWNIEKIDLTSTAMVRPVEDRINVEHNLGRQDFNCGLLVDSPTNSISFIYKKNLNLMVVNEDEDNTKWKLLKVHTRLNLDRYTNLPYDLSENLHRAKKLNDYRLRRKKEILDLFNSLSSIKATDISLGSGKAKVYETYEINPFIKNEFRLKKNQTILNFHVEDAGDSLFLDKLSYALGEIELYFPEFKCQGVATC